MSRLRCQLAAVAAGAMVSSALAAPVTVFQLSDVKLDGQVGENTLFFGTAGSPSFDGTTLSTGSITSGRYVYFASYFNEQTLANVGDKLVFNFTANLTGTISAHAQSLRLGLSHSNGSRPSTNNLTTASDSAFSNDVGYIATYRVDNGAPGSTNILYQRSISNSVLLSTGSFAALSGSPTLPQLNASLGVPFNGTVTLERVPTGIQFTTNLKNTGDQTVVDTVSPYTSFDTLSLFYIPNNGAGALNVTAMSVQSVPIPEPAALATLGTLAGLGVLRRRRMRESV